MLENFDHFLILINPSSTGVQQTKKRISELQSLVTKQSIEIIEMTVRGRKANSALLQSKADILGPKTLLCIAAGDGSAGLIIENLMLDKTLPHKAQQTRVLPLWGGNANDLANMLNGSASHAQLKSIFLHGQVVPIYFLNFLITSKDQTQQSRIAVCNASFGATAYVAEQLNESNFRGSPLHKLPGGRLLKESAVAVSSLLKATPFAAEDAGTQKKIYERTFSNGSRFAKHYRMPVRLNDERFYLNTVEGKRYILTALVLSASFRRRYSEKYLHRSIDFVIHEDTQAQFDGETLSISAGSKIAVTMSNKPFYAVSTLLTDN